MPFDWEALLEKLPVALAGRSPSMMQGFTETLQKLQQQKMQQGQAAGQQQVQQAQLRNMEADNTRAEQQAALDRLTKFRSAGTDLSQQVAETATDPVAGNLGFARDVTGLAEQFGLPPSAAAGLAPNLNVTVSARKKKQAKDLYDHAEKLYGAEAMASDSLTLQSEQFGAVKPSALRAIFATPAVNAQGQPAAPFVGKQSPPTPGSFEEFVGAPPERQAQIAAARKQYMQADDTSKTPPRDRFNVQPVTNPNGTVGLIRVNLETGETSRIALPDDAAGAGKPNPTEQLSAAYLMRTKAADATALSFESQLAALGPQLDVQLPNLLKSEAGQRYRQAQDEFINAALRRESGAAIQPSEYDRFAKIYFVQPRDTPATIAQKQASRDRVVAGFKVATGNLGQDVAPVPSHAPPTGVEYDFIPGKGLVPRTSQ